MESIATSYEDAINEEGTRKGISHDVIYDCFDKIIERVTEENPAETLDWRLGKAEELVWITFFPEKPFPGNEISPPTMARAESLPEGHVKIESEPRDAHFAEVKIGDGINIKKEPVDIHAPRTSIAAQHSRQPFQTRSKTFTGSGIFDLQTQTSDHFEQAGGQARIILRKGKEMGLSMQDFATIFADKVQIAQKRFPCESTDWQTWLAGSMTWSFYFKDNQFPGKEPSRLFPLRSTYENEPRPYKSPITSDNKWVKNAGPSHFGIGTNMTKLDSYRPSGTVSRIDRAIAVSVDSYRPAPAAFSPPLGVKTSPETHNSLIVCRPPGTTDHKRQDSGTKSICLVDSNKSSVQQSNLPITVLYEPLERVMERKAKALGVRREFFQYLQRKRDEVRAAHPACSTQYRHWAADSKVWARFFSKERFPSPEPQAGHGYQLHSDHCPISRNQKIVGQPFKEKGQTGQHARAPPLPKNQPLSRQVTASASAYPTQQSDCQHIADPPMALKLSLNSQLLTLSPTVSSMTKAIMVDETITWTTSTTIKKIAGRFAKIDSIMLDMVENELQCHLRCSELPSGHLIIWHETFVEESQDEVLGGHGFLVRWLNLHHPGPGVEPVAMSFKELWSDFKKARLQKYGPHKLKNVEDPGNTRNLMSCLDFALDFDAAENDWQRYANSFQATDLDRLIIEEAAKAEGAMRMVFDERTSQVISLGEFARRLSQRARNGYVELPDLERGGKRKAIEDRREEVPMEKKAKITLFGPI